MLGEKVWLINMSDWARRQLYIKNPAVVNKKKDVVIDPQTGKEEWENEYDKEEMYENPFS